MNSAYPRGIALVQKYYHEPDPKYVLHLGLPFKYEEFLLIFVIVLVFAPNQSIQQEKDPVLGWLEGQGSQNYSRGLTASGQGQLDCC